MSTPRAAAEAASLVIEGDDGRRSNDNSRLGLSVDDCHKTCKGISMKGVEAVMRDNTGNWLVLAEPREFTPDEFK